MSEVSPACVVLGALLCLFWLYVLCVVLKK